MTTLINIVTNLLININEIVEKYDSPLLQTISNNKLSLNEQLNKYVYENNLEMAKYLILLGAKCDTYTLTYAVETKNLEMIRYIIEMEKAIHSIISLNDYVTTLLDKLNKIVEKYDSPLLQTVIDNKTDIQEQLYKYVRENNLEMVKYLVLLGAVCDKNALHFHIKFSGDNIALLYYLSNNGARCDCHNILLP